MKVLIIEDEVQASRRLESLVKEIEPGIQVLALLDSVKESVKWLKVNDQPDLILMDIQLGDGLCFEIFSQIKVRSPIVFTTAYDEYALKAFKVNSVDYILKPVDKDELKAALQKFKERTGTEYSAKSILDNIGQVVEMLTKRYKERFVIKVGEHLRTIEVKDILYFYSQDKATFCHTNDHRNCILDFTMDQLEEMVDPSVFFRVSRKFLVSSLAISDMISYTNSRLRLEVKGSTDSDIIVARERVQEFKQWLDR